MDQFMQSWFPALQWLATLAVVAIVFWLRTTIRNEISEVTRTMQDAINVHADRISRVESDAREIEPLKDRVGAFADRVTRLEEQLKALPQGRDFQKLSDKVGEMAGDIKELTAENRALHGMMDRIEKTIGVINETLLSKP
jgi:hypothetical protein